jgi:hypothetical protein
LVMTAPCRTDKKKRTGAKGLHQAAFLRSWCAEHQHAARQYL